MVWRVLHSVGALGRPSEVAIIVYRKDLEFCQAIIVELDEEADAEITA